MGLHIVNNEEQKDMLIDEKKWKKPLIIILFFIICVIVIIPIYTNINSQKIDARMEALETVENNFTDWSDETDVAIKALMKDALLVEVRDLIDAYDATYVAQRGLLIEAELIREDSREDTIALYQKVRMMLPNSYLAPIALMQEAIAYEELENISSAMSAYQELLDIYKDVSIDAPRAQFALGRLAELQNKPEQAEQYYQLVLDNYTGNWMQLAQTRLLQLQINKKQTAGNSAQSIVSDENEDADASAINSKQSHDDTDTQ